MQPDATEQVSRRRVQPDATASCLREHRTKRMVATPMSTSIFDDPDARFEVVVNEEEQYSIWPADREPPVGWTKAGKVGTKAECLALITEVWTDMRPLSLRLAHARG